MGPHPRGHDARDLNTFESHGFFDELQRVKANALTQPATMTQGLLNLIGGLLSLGGLAIAVVLLQPLLLPILLLGAGPLWFLTRRSSRLEFQFQLAQTPLTRLRIYLAELLVGRAEAKEIRAFDLADPLMERWSSATRPTSARCWRTCAGGSSWRGSAPR